MSLIRREAITALSLYLGHVHPMLCGGAELGAPLWPSLHKGKPEMTAHGIYTCITQITAAHLGHPVTPHMFRDAAATFIAEMTPERAMMAAAVLQHRNLETTMRHYIHGQQHLAARKYHAAVARGPARGRITRLPKRARSAAEAARAPHAMRSACSGRGVAPCGGLGPSTVPAPPRQLIEFALRWLIY